MFLQVHTLTSYPASLLNRDDAGLAKRIPFGDATRLRVSSQCLKRHWRDYLMQRVSLPDGERTRYLFGRAIYSGLIDGGIPPETALAVTVALKEILIDSKGSTDDGEEGERADSKKKAVKDEGEIDLDGALRMSQPVFFGKPETNYLISLAKTCIESSSGTKDAVERVWLELTGEKQKPKKKRSETGRQQLRDSFKAMLKAAGVSSLQAGLTGAMCGRFVTSDILARVDAPVHVAHAFTIHAAQTEMDYFTVVDDLNRDDEAGAAHAGDAELGAGLYYGYVAVDVPLLVSNLTGCEQAKWREQEADAAREVLTALARAIAEQSPGAKLGATAPYSRAELVLLEAGTAQPRSLANAYLKALKSTSDPSQPDPMQQATDRLGTYMQQLDGMYGITAGHRALATIKDARKLAPLNPAPLDVAIAATLDSVFGA